MVKALPAHNEAISVRILTSRHVFSWACWDVGWVSIVVSVVVVDGTGKKLLNVGVQTYFLDSPVHERGRCWAIQADS